MKEYQPNWKSKLFVFIFRKPGACILLDASFLLSLNESLPENT